MKIVAFLTMLLLAGNAPAHSIEPMVAHTYDAQDVEMPVNMSTSSISEELPSNNDIATYVKTKTFSKTYSTSQSKKLVLSNKYGPVDIRIWNKNEVKADVVMKATSDSERDAVALINGVSIEESQNSEQISIKTLLEISKGKFGTSTKNGVVQWKREVNISYVIYLPSTLALNASVQHGNLNLADYNGATNLKVQYGSLTTGNLNSTQNQVYVQYGSTTIGDINKGAVTQQYGKLLSIENANELSMNVQYAAAKVNAIKTRGTIKVQYGNGLTIGSVQNLNLNAQYASVRISSILGSATINQQYNTLSIGNAPRLTLNARYVKVSIDELSGDANINASYNNVSINNIKPSVNNLNVSASYVAVSLGFSEQYKGKVEIAGRYTSYKGDSRIVKTREDGSSKYYAGSIGNNGSNSILINAEYGSVTIK